ncbi:SLC13 family permease [Desulfatitalea alkaliphila]|uniref:SLC13 family permease n=1 Tax=Desulfatitalea alkaliphila TaxID=2929485 RepID=A0AA41R4G6_9BACT|nr:SLC13 family permease [Desulfatitalea alkaliphila]MCJ8499133.1 SLC13 family permease [Desulfatitalea alkaliphila]
MEIVIVSLILLATIFLLISERLPVDLTAIGIMVALMLSGILTPPEAVAGFANPAVITVGAMFLLSQGMVRTGVVGLIARRVMDLTRGRAWLALLVVLAIVGLASAFINNTPVVVLFIPVIISMGCRLGVSPSKYLIPISYVSILAGTCTLIGTSTNIIISDLSARSGYGALGMFELAWVGLPLALVGFAFIMVAGPRWLPDLDHPTCELDGQRKRRYLAELIVPRGSALVGLDPCADLPTRYPGLEVVELIRYSHIFHPCRDAVAIAPDDLLLVKGSPNDLTHILQGKDVDLPLSEKGIDFRKPDEAFVVELIIPPQSSLLGWRLRETYLEREEDLHVVAVERSGLHYTERKIKDIRLRIGDILLVWCRADRMEKFRGRSDWIVVEDVHDEIVFQRKAPLAGLIFAAMVAAAATGLADIMVCALTAVFLMLVTGCLPLKEAYRALQSNVLMLIAGTIALGRAMEQTGASQYYADLYLGLFQGWPPVMIMAGFLLLTSISTQVLSNNATAVLLLPIAVSTALGLGVNPKPFIIAVCFGASACFATPIGYQTNLMVYGPGGYKFSDYLKLGIPLNFMVLVGGTLLIPVFWPL